MKLHCTLKKINFKKKRYFHCKKNHALPWKKFISNLFTENIVKTFLQQFVNFKNKQQRVESCTAQVILDNVPYGEREIIKCVNLWPFSEKNSKKKLIKFLTSSLRIISTCSLRCKSSQSSLYFSHSSLVALIFFLRTSRIFDPCTLAVILLFFSFSKITKLKLMRMEPSDNGDFRHWAVYREALNTPTLLAKM